MKHINCNANYIPAEASAVAATANEMAVKVTAATIPNRLTMSAMAAANSTT